MTMIPFETILAASWMRMGAVGKYTEFNDSLIVLTTTH